MKIVVFNMRTILYYMYCVRALFFFYYCGSFLLMENTVREM